MRLPTIKNQRQRTVDETLGLYLTETSLSLRIVNALESEGVLTVGQLLNLKPEDLARVPTLGRSSFHEIFAMLSGLGFRVQNQKA